VSNESNILSELASVQELARLDPLTGLGNVRVLDEIVGKCFREGTPFSLVLFDVASMKRANTLLGYGKVDEMLSKIGGALRKNRGDGSAIRKGGDEFLVVLPRGSLVDALRVRDRVEKAVGFTTLRDGTKVYIAGGVSVWTSGRPFGEILLRAQRAMESRKARLLPS
jgi:diguanylate cyclase (GGDEF)-like protein